MARKLNYGNQVQPDIEPDQLSLMVTDMAELQGLKPVKTDDEVEDRLKFFFEWCSQKHIRPTVSLMCLCLGYSKQTLWNWQKKGGRRGELIDRAKQVLEALMEQWMTTGKINPVSGIFCLKAAFGWRDVMTIEAVPRRDPLLPDMTPDQIDAYLQEIDKRIPNFKLEADPEYQKQIAKKIPMDVEYLDED